VLPRGQSSREHGLPTEDDIDLGIETSSDDDDDQMDIAGGAAVERGGGQAFSDERKGNERKVNIAGYILRGKGLMMGTRDLGGLRS